jgi:hypothetical protein
MRGHGGAPQNVNFIVVGRARTDEWSGPLQRFVHVHVQGSLGRLVFKFFRVNMVERRLQGSPQERKNTEDDAGSPHSSHQSITVLREEVIWHPHELFQAL